MGGQSNKKVRKQLHYYKVNFNIHGPYSVLVDSNFIKSALDSKAYLKEELPKFLQDKAYAVTTGCVLEDLRRRGEEYSGAALIAKKMQRIPCPHTISNKKKSKIVKFDNEKEDENKTEQDQQPVKEYNGPVSPKECIMHILEENPFHYIVGADDEDLRRDVRKNPGTPLIFFSHHKLILETISKATKNYVNKKISERLVPTKEELKILKPETATSTTTTATTNSAVISTDNNEHPTTESNKEGETTETLPQQPPKKRKHKEPNPLSCLKKKKKATSEKEKKTNHVEEAKNSNNDSAPSASSEKNDDPTTTTEETALQPEKKKRKRVRNRKKKEETNSAIDEQSATVNDEEK